MLGRLRIWAEEERELEAFFEVTRETDDSPSSLL